MHCFCHLQIEHNNHIYIYFGQFNQFKPHYRLEDAIRMIFITLIILKLPFN